MELQRQFAVGALELLIGGGAGYAQHLVVVAFSVAGQNGLSQNPFGSSDEFSAWGCLRLSPSKDAAGGLSICSPAATRRAHDDPRLRWCPPFQSPGEDADRRARPWPGSDEVPVWPVHPATACRSIRLRHEILSYHRRWYAGRVR